MNESIVNDLVAEAKDYFAQKYNCSQSTFAPFAKYYGMDMNIAFKISTPFGGGFGHMGEPCGAVCGALMALGLEKGNAVVDREKKHACYHLAAEFQERFKAEHGSVLCPNLLGLDISDPEQLQEARDRDLFAQTCPKYIESAIRLMADILELD
ncbi:MAG: C_GCAxxG_C_C family protein, partial [Anaerolineaceae bacterium]|nr:C_GCAxxG_C_C family protein [Anaerolineaceae bacterium]